MSLRGAKRRSNLKNVIVIKEIATLPLVARNDKKGIVGQPSPQQAAGHLKNLDFCPSFLRKQESSIFSGFPLSWE